MKVFSVAYNSYTHQYFLSDSKVFNGNHRQEFSGLGDLIDKILSIKKKKFRLNMDGFNKEDLGELKDRLKDLNIDYHIN